MSTRRSTFAYSLSYNLCYSLFLSVHSVLSVVNFLLAW
jgi:hypothetical protein